MPEPIVLRRFMWQARDPQTGKLRRGEERGVDAHAVRLSLRRAGLQVVAVEASAARRLPRWLRPLETFWNGRLVRRRRLARADFLEGLGTMLEAGLPVHAALSALAASDARKRGERRLLRYLSESVRDGVTLADAAQDVPDWFDALDVALMRAGQRSGELSPALDTITEHLRRSGATAHRLLTALAYPAILSIAALLVVCFLSVHTLPRLVQMLEGAQLAVPTLTQVVMVSGQTLVAWGWIILPIMLAGVLGMISVLRRLPPNSLIARAIRHLPWVRAQRRMRMAHLSFTLSRLQHAGVPLTEALEVAADTADDGPLARCLHEAAESVRSGAELSATLAKSRLFDEELPQLLHLGEQSGELAQLLERLAGRFERSAQRASERLATFLEPIAVIGMAVLVGLVALAAVLPLVRLGDML